MKKKSKRKQKLATVAQAKTKAKPTRRDITWMIGLTSNGRRVRSYQVAHAVTRVGAKILCGRSRTAKWAGYKSERIASFIKAPSFERTCRRCLYVLFPTPPRRKKR